MKLVNRTLGALLIAGAVHAGALAQTVGNAPTAVHAAIERVTDGNTPSNSGPHGAPLYRGPVCQGLESPSSHGHPSVIPAPSSSGNPHGMPSYRGPVCQGLESPSSHGHPSAMPTPLNTGNPHSL